MTANSGLRSAQWFGETGRSGMVYRSWMRSQGFTPEVFDGRPVIGIATTWPEAVFDFTSMTLIGSMMPVASAVTMMSMRRIVAVWIVTVFAALCVQPATVATTSAR